MSPSICLTVRLSVCLSACLFVCLSVCYCCTCIHVPCCSLYVCLYSLVVHRAHSCHRLCTLLVSYLLSHLSAFTLYRETREPEDHLFQNSTLDSRMGSSTPRLAHLEFGPPPAHAYSGSNVSSSTMPSIHSHATLHTQSTHSLLQAKYSRAQHQWLNEGFSQDTPEHQRRREFIRGIDEMDNGSVIAESVASTYV